MNIRGKEPKKVYTKPVLTKQKMKLGVYGDYNPGDGDPGQGGKDNAGLDDFVQK